MKKLLLVLTTLLLSTQIYSMTFDQIDSEAFLTDATYDYVKKTRGNCFFCKPPSDLVKAEEVVLKELTAEVLVADLNGVEYTFERNYDDDNLSYHYIISQSLDKFEAIEIMPFVNDSAFEVTYLKFDKKYKHWGKIFSAIR